MILPMVMIYGLFEILMLLCFATAWPFSIYKLYKSGSNQGKSIVFSYVVLLGYVFGMTNKVINNDVNYVLAFYILDFVLVSLDMVMYYRNMRRQKERHGSEWKSSIPYTCGCDTHLRSDATVRIEYIQKRRGMPAIDRRFYDVVTEPCVCPTHTRRSRIQHRRCR